MCGGETEREKERPRGKRAEVKNGGRDGGRGNDVEREERPSEIHLSEREAGRGEEEGSWTGAVITIIIKKKNRK